MITFNFSEKEVLFFYKSVEDIISKYFLEKGVVFYLNNVCNVPKKYEKRIPLDKNAT